MIRARPGRHPAVAGHPARHIITIEQEVEADQMVLGKHHSHLAEDPILGNVNTHMLAKPQCDVWVIADPRVAAEPLP